ncbi:DUF4255 domain-containing protein [Paraburkholderia sp. Tr-20389]|uniref:DUF4255 domain-containing protein n=1 Tax=Paraburkholderia sp. Tr-20389 TaxID=2703903 RepID=UPI001982132B|nr:DUF4255 domain-containing protein [Paraburkholderia sp. Tr-20389]MBN3753683.1 DUF4255 domain-containing protein [Paraburkholderia sp. Tr-20389]
MSNALAIASVTETLLHVLTGCLDRSGVSGATVTAVRPDQPSQLPNPGVNIFLYQVSPNVALRNADLPTRSPDGTLLRRPQAALDLHYLFTFYGEDLTLQQQRLLGAVATQMHAFPGLSRDTIGTVQGSVPFLNSADLDAQAELVRFTPINFSLEELSKLWSFLLKTDYVLSTAYLASVVLLETDDTEPPPPLPILNFNVYATSFAQPSIEQILPDTGTLILPSSTLIVSGRNFVRQERVNGVNATAPVQVLISGVTATPGSVTPMQLRVPLPAGLRAGANTAEVVLGPIAGGPPGTIQSGLAAFVLHPVIQDGEAGSPAQIAVESAGSPDRVTLTARLSPTVQVGQRVLLELIPLSKPTAVQLFDGGAMTVASDFVSVTFTRPATGDYLVRLRVDGAETPLQPGAGGSPAGPFVSL